MEMDEDKCGSRDVRADECYGQGTAERAGRRQTLSKTENGVKLSQKEVIENEESISHGFMR